MWEGVRVGESGLRSLVLSSVFGGTSEEGEVCGCV